MRTWIFTALVMFAAAMSRESFAQTATLRAGAAKVDVTPAENALPRNYEGILDHLYSRAIVIDSGVTSAALVSLDAGGVPEQIWQNVTQQVERELGIPAKNVLITATHTHSAPGQQAAAYVQKSSNLSVLRSSVSLRRASAMAPAFRTSTSIATSSIPRRNAGGKARTTMGSRTRQSRSSSSSP